MTTHRPCLRACLAALIIAGHAFVPLNATAQTLHLRSGTVLHGTITKREGEIVHFVHNGMRMAIYVGEIDRIEIQPKKLEAAPIPEDSPETRKQDPVPGDPVEGTEPEPETTGPPADFKVTRHPVEKRIESPAEPKTSVSFQESPATPKSPRAKSRETLRADKDLKDLQPRPDHPIFEDDRAGAAEFISEDILDDPRYRIDRMEPRAQTGESEEVSVSAPPREEPAPASASVRNDQSDAVRKLLSQIGRLEMELTRKLIARMQDYIQAKDAGDKEAAEKIVRDRIRMVREFKNELAALDTPSGAEGLMEKTIAFQDAKIAVEEAVIRSIHGGEDEALEVDDFIAEMRRMERDVAASISRLTRAHGIERPAPEMVSPGIPEGVPPELIRQNNLAREVYEETLRLHQETVRLHQITRQLQKDVVTYMDDIITYQQERIKQRQQFRQYLRSPD